MKLIELDPIWVRSGEDRHGMGLGFLCPHCNEERLGIFFKNPIDGGPALNEGRPLWNRVGETFEELSLSPSIDCSGHWHGYITNGEIIFC